MTHAIPLDLLVERYQPQGASMTHAELVAHLRKEARTRYVPPVDRDRARRLEEANQRMDEFIARQEAIKASTPKPEPKPFTPMRRPVTHAVDPFDQVSRMLAEGKKLSDALSSISAPVTLKGTL